MFRALLLPFQVSFALSCNHFIYTLQRIPWLGKKIPHTVYHIPTIKLILSIAAELTKALGRFLAAALTLGILIFAPLYFMEGSLDNMNLFFHYFFFIFFLIAPLSGNIIFQTRDLSAYTVINILRLPQRDFFFSKIIYELGLKTARYLLLLMLSSLFIDISLLESAMLSGYILFAALIWEYGTLMFFRRFNIDPYGKPVYNIAALAFLLAVCYLPPYWGFVLKMRPVLGSGYLFALLFILAGISLRGLSRFSGYSAVTKQTITRERILEVADLLKTIAFADVNLEEKKLVKEKVAAADSLQGYALFNYLFFRRHRDIIVKPARVKAAVVAVLTLIAWALLLLKPELRGPVRENIFTFSPYLILIMFVLSSGERFSRALFFNCDRYMLKERYYKDKSALLENFTIRLKKTIGLNLLPAAALAFLFVSAALFSGAGGEMVRLIPLLVTIFTLALFFSTHYLFIYYLLQPYTAELTLKNPLYTIINTLIILISCASLQIKTTSLLFTCGVIVFTLLYTAAAIILTYHLAPKTFKLR